MNVPSFILSPDYHLPFQLMRLHSYFDLFEVPGSLSSSSGTKFPFFFLDKSCILPQVPQLCIEPLQPEQIKLSLEIDELSSPQICCSLMKQLLQIRIFLELPLIKTSGKIFLEKSWSPQTALLHPFPIKAVLGGDKGIINKM